MIRLLYIKSLLLLLLQGELLTVQSPLFSRIIHAKVERSDKIARELGASKPHPSAVHDSRSLFLSHTLIDWPCEESKAISTYGFIPRARTPPLQTGKTSNTCISCRNSSFFSITGGECDCHHYTCHALPGSGLLDRGTLQAQIVTVSKHTKSISASVIEATGIR